MEIFYDNAYHALQSHSHTLHRVTTKYIGKGQVYVHNNETPHFTFFLFLFFISHFAVACLVCYSNQTRTLYCAMFSSSSSSDFWCACNKIYHRLFNIFFYIHFLSSSPPISSSWVYIYTRINFLANKMRWYSSCHIEYIMRMKLI